MRDNVGKSIGRRTVMKTVCGCFCFFTSFIFHFIEITYPEFFEGTIYACPISWSGKKLWSAADELRANSELKSSEYSVPVLGVIFLKYADVKFAQAKTELKGKGSGRRTISKTDYHARGVLYLLAVVLMNASWCFYRRSDVSKLNNDLSFWSVYEYALYEPWCIRGCRDGLNVSEIKIWLSKVLF